MQELSSAERNPWHRLIVRFASDRTP